MRIATLLLLTLVATSTAGCVGCEPLLEARNCLENQCPPSDDAVEVTWSEADAQAWPDVERLLDGLAAGEHEHQKWNTASEAAFWDHYGVEGTEKELLVHRGDEQFRVRVLTCD